MRLTDHKRLAVAYGLTAGVFLLVGFLLMLLLRWQLAWPGRPIPIATAIFGETNAPGGILLPEFFNQLTTMHGIMMVFGAIMPAFVGFANWQIPERFLFVDELPRTSVGKLDKKVIRAKHADLYTGDQA